MKTLATNRLKRILFIVTLLISWGASNGCAQTAGLKIREKEKTDSADTTVQDESFDGNQFQDHVWVIEPVIRRMPPSDTVAGYPLMKEEAGEGEMKSVTVSGYRVQLFSTTDYYAAVRTRNDAASRFTEEIIMDFEPPYYKIRAGNFTDRQKAEELRSFARTAGYPEAWVIQTKVTINK